MTRNFFRCGLMGVPHFLLLAQQQEVFRTSKYIYKLGFVVDF